MKKIKIIMSIAVIEMGLALFLFSPSNYSRRWDGEMFFNGLLLVATGLMWFFRIVMK